MKAVILTRVSTKMQEERLSLRAQSKRLEEYAERRELDVIKRFEIIESSTRGERKRFMEMISDKAMSKFKFGFPSIEEQERIVSILDEFNKLTNEISDSLQAEITARKKQYEYYRNKLLTFKEAV